MMEPSEWIPVGALGDAFAPDSNVLPHSNVLDGRQLVVHLEDGSSTRLEFGTQGRLTVNQGHEDGRAGRSTVQCYVAEVRRGVIFLDYIDPAREARSVSMVLDLGVASCTVIQGSLPDAAGSRRCLLDRAERGESLTGVEARCLSGSIDAPFTGDTPRHPVTADLIGKRVRYTYSRSELYEHIYLSPYRYTWHCLEGAEAGLADTDQCFYRRIAGGLYLFSWQEKIVPTLGVVLVDLLQARTCGKVFGYKGFSGSGLSNFPVGARISAVIEPPV